MIFVKTVERTEITASVIDTVILKAAGEPWMRLSDLTVGEVFRNAGSAYRVIEVIEKDGETVTLLVENTEWK